MAARKDPRVPKDGSCHVCGKPRQPERSRTYGKTEAEHDPFCSSNCAREYHRNPLPEAYAGPRDQGGWQAYMRK